MATRYDIESLLVDMVAFMKANLPGKLTAITTEKGDSLTLTAPANASYTFQAPSFAMANYNPFLLYGIDDILPDRGEGPATAKPYQLFVIIGLNDEGNDPNLFTRLLRYQRALEDLFEANWASIASSVKFRVSGLVPVPLALFAENDAVKNTKIIGVSLSATLA